MSQKYAFFNGGDGTTGTPGGTRQLVEGHGKLVAVIVSKGSAEFWDVVVADVNSPGADLTWETEILLVLPPQSSGTTRLDVDLPYEHGLWVQVGSGSAVTVIYE